MRDVGEAAVLEARSKSVLDRSSNSLGRLHDHLAGRADGAREQFGNSQPPASISNTVWPGHDLREGEDFGRMAIGVALGDRRRRRGRERRGSLRNQVLAGGWRRGRGLGHRGQAFQQACCSPHAAANASAASDTPAIFQMLCFMAVSLWRSSRRPGAGTYTSPDAGLVREVLQAFHERGFAKNKGSSLR